MQGDEVDANISEVQKIQIKRYKLEKWAYEPFFEKTVVGCMVKVAYSGKYHVAEILEVQERELGRHRQVSLQWGKHKRPMFHWPYAEAVGQARMPPVNLCWLNVEARLRVSAPESPHGFHAAVHLTPNYLAPCSP